MLGSPELTFSNSKIGLFDSVIPLGPEVIVVFGGLESTVQVIVSSTNCPLSCVALTVNDCPPSGSPSDSQ